MELNTRIEVKAKDILAKEEQVLDAEKVYEEYVLLCMSAKICPKCGESIIYDYDCRDPIKRSLFYRILNWGCYRHLRWSCGHCGWDKCEEVYLDCFGSLF